MHVLYYLALEHKRSSIPEARSVSVLLIQYLYQSSYFSCKFRRLLCGIPRVPHASVARKGYPGLKTWLYPSTLLYSQTINRAFEWFSVATVHPPYYDDTEHTSSLFKFRPSNSIIFYILRGMYRPSKSSD